MTLDTGAYLSALAADSQAFADRATDLDAAVTACPGWAVADLVGHLGGVYSWVQLALAGAGSAPTGTRDRPPEDRSALMGWFLDHRARVIDALTEHEPDAPAWNFTGGGGLNVAWWRRRQAMETAIHRFDMESAFGSTHPIAPDLSADGVDEFLTALVPYRNRGRTVEGLTGTLHLHATDADGEWLIDLDSPGFEVTRQHAKGDAAVRGRASGLFLWVWNRLSAEEAGLECFGDLSLVAAWRNVRL